MALGRCDADTVFCGLCNWSHPIHSIEGAEFLLGRHLWETHKRRLRYRVCDEDGVKTDIPEVET